MRWIFRIVSALVVVAIFAVGAVAMLPADRIARLVAEQFEIATGRVLIIEGDIRPSLWPDLGISTGSFSVSNASWSDAGPMVQAEGLNVGVDIAALWGGAIRVKQVEVIAPVIALEVNGNGTGNWEFVGAGTEAAVIETGGSSNSNEASETTAKPNFALDLARVSRGRISYFDHATGHRSALSGVTGTVRLPDLNGPADFDLAGVMNSQSFRVDGTFASFADVLAQHLTGTNFDLVVGGNHIDFKGVLGLSPVSADGKIALNLADQAALFSLLGQAVPALPKGFGRDTLNASGDLSFVGSRVSLRNAALQLDQNALAGTIEVMLKDRPLVSADLRGGALDFSTLTGASGPAAGGGPNADALAPTGWSKDYFDASALNAVDANFKLVADALNFGVAKLGRTQIATVLDAGRAVTEVKELSAYGGQVAGSFVLNGRNGFSARANLRGRGVALQPLLVDMAQYDRLIGTGDVTINVLAIGNDMDTLMRSLSGDGSVRLGKGELRGLDLAGMIRNLDPSFVGQGAKTIFNDFAGSFTLKNGVLRNDDFLLNASVLAAAGKGLLDIGGKAIDYRMSAKLLENKLTGDVRVPVIIKGMWSGPKIRLDLKSLAEQEFADEIEQVKTVVERAVVKKVEEETGINLENLNNIEDKLKKELEQRAVGGVLKLLSGN